MKVLMFTDYFPPHIGGGVEKAVYEMSKALVRSGLAVSVLTLNTRNAPQFESLDGLSVYRANSSSVGELIGLQASISTDALPLALRICREVKPDILHAHNIFFSTALTAALVKRFLATPLVVTMQLGSVRLLEGVTGLLAAFYERTGGKWILDNSNHIIAASRAVLEHALSLGIPKKKVTLIPNGVDLPRSVPRPNGQHSRTKKIVFVGRLFSNKGLRYLVQASPFVLARHQTEFVVVGDGPDRGRIERLAKTVGVREAFKFLGCVPSLAEVLRQCDIFVRPSLTEGMPLAVLDAMACGLPVVASDVGGTPELVTHGVTGLLCPPKDSQRLAEAILQLLDNPAMAVRLGCNAEASVHQHPDWQRVAQMTRGVYELVARAA